MKTLIKLAFFALVTTITTQSMAGAMTISCASGYHKVNTSCVTIPNTNGMQQCKIACIPN